MCMYVMVFRVFLNPFTLRFDNKDCSSAEINNFKFFFLQMSLVSNIQKTMVLTRLLK